MVFAAALVARILIAPLSLGPFTGQLRASLGRALPGLGVRFDDAALKWSRDEGRLNLVIFGARVFDENQRIIAQAPEAEVGLAVVPFLKGHVVVQRIALVGVQLTLVHGKDGVLRLGTGGSDNQSDVLQRIRDAIAKSGNGASSLDNFAVEKARLAFFDEETGAFVVAPEAHLQITRGTGAPGNTKGAIKANVDAHIEISGAPARVQAVLTLPATGDDVTGDISITGLSTKSLAANAKFFSFLAPFDMKTDVSGSFAIAHGTQVRSADFGLGAAGIVYGLGKPVHVRSLKLAGRYDGATGRLLIDDASLEGIQARAHMTGSGDLVFASAGGLTKASLELQMDKLAVNMPDVMGHQVTVARAAFRGSYLPSSRTIAIDQGLVYGGQLSAKFTGRVVLADGRSPEVDIDGSMAAISVRDLLRYWPLQTAPGARGWIDANVPQGRLGPVVVHTAIPTGALDEAALPEKAVAMSFPISGATIVYIRGLTPMTGVSGTATLSGDTFKAQIDSGAAGPLKLSRGAVVIPNLHLRGTLGVVTAHVDGTVPDVLALLDQKPLRYPSRFQIRTASARGNASVDMTVRVPMLRDVKVDDIGISARAATTGLGLALSDHFAIANGNVNFVIDNTSLHAVGTVALASANLGIDWTEDFKPKGPVSTRVKVSGTLPESALEELGVHANDYFSGPVGVTGELDGYRGKLQRAQLKEDITPTAVNIRMLGYKKPAGVPAQAQVTLRMDSAGNVRNADMVLAGTALSARGTARFGPAGDLQYLDIPSFRSGQYNDFALNLTRDSAQGTVVSMTGRSFDGENLVRDETSSQTAQPAAKTDPSATPYRISAKLDRVVIREGVLLAPFSLNVSGVGTKPRTLALSATQSKSAQLMGGITNAEDGSHLKLSAGDAGLFFKGLFGSTSLRGGALQIDAVMSPSTAKGDNGTDYAGKLTVTDFNMVNQPFLTRLFAAGSFGGFANLLGGKGISVDTTDVPFALHADVLSVHDARATGPSLGLTADGYYDLKTNQIALQGVFTPLYGINGFVNNIPLLGTVLGSKKGEGFIGVTYSASGEADNPSVFANPISALTPGIFRRIFQGNAALQPPAPPPPPTPIQKPQ
ncbi:MAG TPA: AsmA-like C-terminal domain-containing protein [Rhizomicrobium sp.]|nr:AsmA-like C-terminal domain-containing protein [Rhizomicrobium sp.]